MILTVTLTLILGACTCAPQYHIESQKITLPIIPYVAPPAPFKAAHIHTITFTVPVIELPPITPLEEMEQATNNFLNGVRNLTNSQPVWFSNTIDLHREIRCLTQNIYYEARGETLEGKLAIANTTLNRVKSFLYPETVCGVVWQPYQFSWTLRHTKHIPLREVLYWKQAQMIASAALQGGRIDNLEDVTNGAINFHTIYVHPRWRRDQELQRTVTIDHHVFYRLNPLITKNQLLVGGD